MVTFYVFLILTRISLFTQTHLRSVGDETARISTRRTNRSRRSTDEITEGPGSLNRVPVLFTIPVNMQCVTTDLVVFLEMTEGNDGKFPHIVVVTLVY